jgi:hypothetical protein
VSIFTRLLGRINGLMWLTFQGSALASAYFLDSAHYAQIALGMNAIRTGIDVLTTPAMQKTLPSLRGLIAERVNPTLEFRQSVIQVVALSVFCAGGVFTFGQLAIRLTLGESWGTEFPISVSLMFAAFPLSVHACLDRAWLVLMQLEKLDSKVKVYVAFTDICEAILFASFGFIWCSVGLCVRSLSGFCLRQLFSGTVVPSLRDQSMVLAMIPVAVVPTILFLPEWVHQICGIFLMVYALRAYFLSNNRAHVENDSSWENFCALNPQLRKGI